MSVITSEMCFNKPLSSNGFPCHNLILRKNIFLLLGSFVENSNLPLSRKEDVRMELYQGLHLIQLCAYKSFCDCCSHRFDGLGYRTLHEVRHVQCSSSYFR
jgi:hypothetical protein